MMLYRLLSVLLDYPNDEVCAHLDEFSDMVRSLEYASEPQRQAITGFVDWAQAQSPTEWQAKYVQTFDLTPDHSLYLTHHLLEEQDRDRGPTLVKLVEYFRACGFEIAEGQLPDYLPLLLEYVSTLPDERNAVSFLRQSHDAIAVVAHNLEQIDSPYGPLLNVVLEHSSQDAMTRHGLSSQGS